MILGDPFDFARTLGATNITLPKVLLIAVILGLVLRRASVAVLLDARVRGIIVGALAIFVATALSAIPAIYIDSVAREVLKSLQNAVTLGAAAVAFAADPDEDSIWIALTIVTASVCLLAIAQEFSIAPSGVIIEGRIFPRIAGPLDGPNQLAGYFDLAIPMLVAGISRPTSRGPMIGVLALAAATDVLTLSRAGLLGVVPGIVLAVAVGSKVNLRRFVTFALAGILTVAVALARVGALARFLSAGEVDRDNGLATRPILWGAAIKLWLTDPSLGIGAGNFELRTPSVGLVGVRTHANSLYLQSLAEGGILLFAAVVWTFANALVTMIRQRAHGPLVIGIAAATVALATHEFLDDLSFFPKVGGYWWILLGIGIGAITTNGFRGEPRIEELRA